MSFDERLIEREAKAGSFLMLLHDLLPLSRAWKLAPYYVRYSIVNESLVHLVGIWVEPRVISTYSSLSGADMCFFIL